MIYKKSNELSSKEIAKILPYKVSPDDINYLARNNRIPGKKRGSRWFFDRKDIKSIIRIIGEVKG